MTAAEPEKVAGMLFGGAVGDALGWPQENRSRIVGGNSAREVEPQPEFRVWRRYAGTQFAQYVDPVGAGEYSDDTQLLLAVAHACLRGPDWLDWLTRVELPQWMEYQRGGGGAVLRASRSWASGRAPWEIQSERDDFAIQKYFAAGANGAAMRIAPHVGVTASSDVGELVQRVVIDSLCTHGHPRAVIGAVIHALALRHALLQAKTLEYGEILESVIDEKSWQNPDILFDAVPPEWISSYQEVKSSSTREALLSWNSAIDETIGKLTIANRGLSQGAIANDHQVLDDIGCFGPEGGSGTVSAVAAMYVAARTATRPISGLIRTAFLRNADTDTISSMTASLLGAIHGTTWLNGFVRTVQDSDHLHLICDSLLTAGLQERRTRGGSGITVSSSQTKAWTRRLFDTVSSYAMPDGRPFEILNVYRLPTKSNYYVARVVIQTNDRQTFFIDKISKSQNRAWRVSKTAPDLEGFYEARDGTPTDKRSDTLTQQSGAPAVAVIAIELTTARIEETRYFYSHVLGLPCRIEGDRLRVGEFLFFSTDSSTKIEGSNGGVIITLAVPNRDELFRRLESSSNIRFSIARHSDNLWLQDPNNNRIRIISG